MLVSYRLVPVNRWTWDDMPPNTAIRGVVSASVSKQAGSGSNLIDSATLSVSSDISYEFEEGWYRLEATYLGEENRRIPIGTFYMYPVSDTVRGNHKVTSVNGTSVLTPLTERKVLSGDYVAKGASASDKVRRLINDAMPNIPVEVFGSFTLNEYYVFDPGQKYLDIVWGLLDKADWCLQITSNGTIKVKPRPDTPSLILGQDRKSLLKNDINRSYDRSAIPNRLKVIDQYGQEYVVENHQPGSKTSYEARGRWIDVVDTNPQQKDGETTPAYARRQLELASTWAYTYTFDSHWIDDVVPYDIIRATLPNEGVEGDLRVLGQTIQCGTNLSINWSVGREVKEYVAWQTNQSILESSENS